MTHTNSRNDEVHQTVRENQRREAGLCGDHRQKPNSGQTQHNEIEAH